jgi:hypothetical protein
MDKTLNPSDGGSETGSLNKKTARKRAAPATTNVPRRAADSAERASRLPQLRTAEDIANEETAQRLALRIWVATVAQKILAGMSALFDELIGSPMLNDDDEEVDEAWRDDHHKRESRILDEAITVGLDKYPDFNATLELPPNCDPVTVRAADQLKDVLSRCAIGATEFKDKFSRAQLERMVRSKLKEQFKESPKYSQHIREDVPGLDVRKYGSRGRTSSLGTFVKTTDYESGGGLDALLFDGWMRVAKDRIDPVAWSHRFGFQRKTEGQNWAHHFEITERNGHKSNFQLPRESCRQRVHRRFACC